MRSVNSQSRLPDAGHPVDGVDGQDGATVRHIRSTQGSDYLVGFLLTPRESDVPRKVVPLRDRAADRWRQWVNAPFVTSDRNIEGKSQVTPHPVQYFATRGQRVFEGTILPCFDV